MSLLQSNQFFLCLFNSPLKNRYFKNAQFYNPQLMMMISTIVIITSSIPHKLYIKQLRQSTVMETHASSLNKQEKSMASFMPFKAYSVSKNVDQVKHRRLQITYCEMADKPHNRFSAAVEIFNEFNHSIRNILFL